MKWLCAGLIGVLGLSASLAFAYPESEDFNEYFEELALLADTTVPYRFTDGGIYEQFQVNENFIAIIEALKRKGLVAHRTYKDGTKIKLWEEMDDDD